MGMIPDTADQMNEGDDGRGTDLANTKKVCGRRTLKARIGSLYADALSLSLKPKIAFVYGLYSEMTA